MMRSPSSASATSRARKLHGRDDDCFDRTACARVDQRRPTAQLRKLAHEAAGAVRDDDLARSESVMLRDVDGAGQNEVKAVTGRPGLRDCFAFAIRSRLAEAPHTLDLECLQHRKHLISPRFNKGSHGCRHVIILAA